MNRRIVACLGLTMALFGCGQGQKPPVSSEVAAASVEAIDGSDHARHLLGSATKSALSEGATDLRIVGADAATEGDRIGGFVEVKSDACLVAYARGTSAVEDLDLLVFDDRGASLLTEESVGALPGVILCPPHPGRVYVAARVSSGWGLVALGVHAVSPERAPALAI
jgi:hypothetical protein